MADYTRLTRKSSASWAAGSIGTPVAEAAYRVQDLDPNIERSDVVATNTFIGEFQTATNRPAGRYGVASFTCELRGQSATDVPAPEGALLRACGFNEDKAGGTYEGYIYQIGDLHTLTMTPAGDLDPVDIKLNLDRMQTQINNCVGSVSFTFVASQIPLMSFNFRGQIDETTATATTSSHAEQAVPTITVGQAPVPWQDARISLRPIAPSTSPIAIVTATAGASGVGYFEIAGDQTNDFRPESQFDVSGSTGNDGTYVVLSSVYDGSTNTAIYTYEAIPDDTDDGSIQNFYQNFLDGVVESVTIDCGLAVHPRPDANEAFGYEQPLLTAFDPMITVQIETNLLDVLNPWNYFLGQSVYDFQFYSNYDGGNGQEILVTCRVKVDNMADVVDNNGKYDLTVVLKQAEGYTSNNLAFTWKSEA